MFRIYQSIKLTSLFKTLIHDLVIIIVTVDAYWEHIMHQALCSVLEHIVFIESHKNHLCWVLLLSCLQKETDI